MDSSGVLRLMQMHLSPDTVNQSISLCPANV